MNITSKNRIGRTRVKVCGITRVEDAISAVESGADAIGFVFFEGSPRYINQEKAAEIVKVLPPFVSKIALFVNAVETEIRSVLDSVSIDLLQFHGEESPEECRRYGKPYIKVVRMHDDIDLIQLSDDYADASALLLDSFVEGIQGGTGQRFDWSRVPADLNKLIILAGGLTVKNVAAAIREVSPYAVDVSGGVEIGKGIKDAVMIEEFIQEVIHAK
ncbi:MAG: phosphoribosylanthranilate isomerase [Gammaproteobacteria bacterium]